MKSYIYAQNDPEAPELTCVYLKADTIDGVTLTEPFEDDYAVLGDMDFYNALTSLEDGEVLYGMVLPEIYDYIKKQYGILG
jgi:hypothetical protein